jgi:hypothetical protein
MLLLATLPLIVTIELVALALPSVDDRSSLSRRGRLTKAVTSGVEGLEVSALFLAALVVDGFRELGDLLSGARKLGRPEDRVSS